MSQFEIQTITFELRKLGVLLERETNPRVRFVLYQRFQELIKKLLNEDT